MKLIHVLSMGLLSLQVLNLSGQTGKEMLDTLNLNCNGKVIASLAAYDYYEFETDTTFQKMVSGLQENIRKISDKLPKEGNYKLIYEPGKSLLVERLTTINKYLVSGDSVTRYPLNNECQIKTEKTAITLLFNNYKDLLDPDLLSCLQAGIEKLPSKGRYARTYHYRYNGSVVTETSEPSKNGNPYDMLVLTGGTGLNLVKNKFAIDLSGKIGFNFSKKGVMRNDYYISDNLMYVFGDESDHFAINNFLNVGYSRNFSFDRTKPRWQGIEIGFPVLKEGELFKDNLFRFGIRFGIGGSIYLNTYLYVNDGFKSAYPGLRISIPF